MTATNGNAPHRTGPGGSTRRRVVVTGLGVVAPNAVGVADFAAALRAGVSGLRRVEQLAELGFGCHVAGVPRGIDERCATTFAADELLAMNSNHRFGRNSSG